MILIRWGVYMDIPVPFTRICIIADLGWRRFDVATAKAWGRRYDSIWALGWRYEKLASPAPEETRP